MENTNQILNKRKANLVEYFPVEILGQFSGDILNRQKSLAAQGYFASLELAAVVEMWWQKPTGPLILEGEPGTGKTSLAIALQKSENAAFYRIDCHQRTSAEHALYKWNERLQNIYGEMEFKAAEKEQRNITAEEVEGITYKKSFLMFGPVAKAIIEQKPKKVCLINELDKVPQREGFESTLLQALDEFAVTIPEINEVLTAPTGMVPRIIITSNAGNVESGGNETLSFPLLRRGPRYKIETHTLAKQYEIILSKCPTLPREVVADCVLFGEMLRHQHMEKQIGLSEIIAWITILESLKIKTLSREVTRVTLQYLAKTDSDVGKIKKNLNRAFDDTLPRRREDWNPEEALRQEKETDLEIENYLSEHIH